jgi:uncharacterized protein (UPF0262 family)
LNEEFFFQFEKYRLSLVETEYEDSTSEVMKELEHIHNKAIFDACNEALNQARPYYYGNYDLQFSQWSTLSLGIKKSLSHNS